MNFASLFAGKMLGDGYMNKTRMKPRFAFIHTIHDKAYAQHCFQLFSQYLPFGPKCGKEENIFDNRTQKIYGRIYYQSKTNELLQSLYTIWYQNGRKVIPLKWVFENLGTDGLAIWFQDDGSLKKGGSRIILSAESFSHDERLFLQSLLHTKFNIHSQIDKQNRIDISTRREVRKFQALVEPLLHLSMARKSMNHSWEEWKECWQQLKQNCNGTCRTSIYLPDETYWQLRGEGYSEFLNNLLHEWLDKQWYESILIPEKRYYWISNNEVLKKGSYLLTPRFRPDVKGRLKLLSEATGFECSELVMIALNQSA